MSQPSNAQTKIHYLATLVRQRQEANEPPYVLILGAGASLASGASSTAKIVETVIRDHGSIDADSLAWEKKLATFYEILDNVSVEERYFILSRHLKGVKPSLGYRHLAALVKAGFFSLILTTNFDLLLENALMDIGLRANEFTVLINGQQKEDQIIKELNYRTPTVKLFKLHGDLNARIFAFTPPEVFEFGNRIEHMLTDILNGDIITIGHGLRDVDLSRCIRGSGGALWYINPSEPSVADFAGQAIRARGTPEHFISGELGNFDAFFSRLHLELILPSGLQVADPQERHLLIQLDASRKQDKRPAMAATLEALGHRYSESAEKERCEACYEEGANILEASGERPGAARLLRILGTFHAQLNRPEQALRCFQRSLELSQEASDRHGEALALMANGRWWWLARHSHRKSVEEERISKAIAYWRRCLPVLQELNRVEARTVEQWLQEAEKERNSK